jgi:hypothetical protein
MFGNGNSSTAADELYWNYNWYNNIAINLQLQRNFQYHLDLHNDGNGRTNFNAQTQTVIVDDTAPVANVANLSAVVTGQCSATVTAPTTLIIVLDKLLYYNITINPQRTFNITWTYNDGNGNHFNTNSNGTS